MVFAQVEVFLSFHRFFLAALVTRKLLSGILNYALWNPGEGLTADGGFTVKEYTDNLNIKLVIPAFLKGRNQLSKEEVVQTQQIASERIHVERMIQRLKTYHIFDRVIPLSMMGSLNQIISVCGLLSNFQGVAAAW